MTTRTRPRKPASAAESDALGAWRQALPGTAMTHLAQAGYDQAAREEFLRNVARISLGDARDFSDDRYITPPGDDYEAGVRAGAAAGVRAHRTGEDTTSFGNPDRTDYDDGYSDGYTAGYWCQARREEAGAESGCYDCPCCGETIMGDLRARTPCDGCKAAGCEPNRKSAYDECRRPCPACGDPRASDWYLLVIWQRADGLVTWADGWTCDEHLPDEAGIPGTYIPADGLVLEHQASRLPR